MEEQPELPKLNEVEKNVFDAIVNHQQKQKIIDLAEEKNVNDFKLTPERRALVEATKQYPPSIAFLPQMLEHIGVDCSQVDMWSYINYISSAFVTKKDETVPHIRVLPLVMLPQYAKVCKRVGHPIDVNKIRMHINKGKKKRAPRKKRSAVTQDMIIQSLLAEHVAAAQTASGGPSTPKPEPIQEEEECGPSTSGF